MLRKLIIKKKWIKKLKERLKDEIDDIIFNLVMRVKGLAKRYKTPLSKTKKQVKDYEKKARERLKVMRL